MKRILIILAAGMMAASCTPYDIEEILLDRSDISVTMRGKEIYSFNPDKAQICFNEARNEYIIFDEDFLNRVAIVWNEKPANSGQKVVMDLDWGTKTSFKKKRGLEFEVKRIDGDGMVWLWNSSDKIGVTIKVF